MNMMISYQELVRTFPKITLAIIINFIYYRHSVLNVCLSLIEPDASHSVFFYLSLRQPTFYVLPLRNDNDY
ncbi:hypothetical protein CS900_05615 (plasmid) [Enterobacter hormaechei]|nr:hypothetical protein CS900_05615 [Enterobacter hormaechei]